MRTQSLPIFFLIVLVAANSRAADIDVTIQSPQFTTASPTARYEIVQSTIAAKATFRLDRYIGRIWELVRTKEDESTWQETKVYNRPQVQAANRPRFQLFTSGLAVRHTFLLDGDTGKTWILVTGKDKEKDGTEVEYRAWQQFAE